MRISTQFSIRFRAHFKNKLELFESFIPWRFVQMFPHSQFDFVHGDLIRPVGDGSNWWEKAINVKYFLYN